MFGLIINTKWKNTSNLHSKYSNSAFFKIKANCINLYTHNGREI